MVLPVRLSTQTTRRFICICPFLLLPLLAGEKDRRNPLRLVLQKEHVLELHGARPHQLSLAVERIEPAVRPEPLRAGKACAKTPGRWGRFLNTNSRYWSPLRRT